jgi:CRISPR system Cascade subunit CasA
VALPRNRLADRIHEARKRFVLTQAEDRFEQGGSPAFPDPALFRVNSRRDIILSMAPRRARNPVLNLLNDPWLPVVRRDSRRDRIRPSQIAEYHAENPVIAIDWPRPDFRVATLEFLIGLLATAFPPDDRSWSRWWRNPPDPNRLDEVLAPFAAAFSLDGDGPRFLQDMEDLVSDPEPIERLLIDTPGESTVVRNTDLIVHRNRAISLGRAAAAMALYTFQSWAPAGGAGNRVGLRGGGPLVTMVLPGVAPTLWQTIWANVPAGGRAPSSEEMPRVFPWLTSTMTSEGKQTVTPQTSHPLQCWWGMPRRIRLDFVTLDSPSTCDLTGECDTVCVMTWRQRPRGANYAGWATMHPLTPRYRPKADGEWLSVHPQPGGVGYRDWLGIVMSNPDGTRLPAGAISTWRDRRRRDARITDTRLAAAGYDMDNMKARAFVETEMPLPAPAEKDSQLLDFLASDLVRSADQVASALRSAVRSALFIEGATVKFDTAVFTSIRDRLWEETEAPFFEMLEQAANRAEDYTCKRRPDWLKRLRGVALTLFDEAAPLTPEIGQTVAQRVSRARRFLGFTLAGYGKAGTELFTLLGLSLPETHETKNRWKAA